MVQRVTYLVRVLGPDDPPDVGQVRAGHRLALRVRRAVFVLGVVLAAAGPLLIGCWGSVNFYSFGALEGQLWGLWALKTEVLGPTWEVLGPSWRSWG